MKKLLCILIFLLILTLTFGQGLFINSAYVIMNGGVPSIGLYIVIDRQASDGITRTSGGIINQDNNENNYVDWIIKNGAINNYIIPWTTAQYIQFTYTITTIGSNDGRLLFSTWQTQSDNTTPVAGGITGWPATVTNVNPDPLFAVDRFWWVKYSGYASKPLATLLFSYADPIEYQAPNTITESDLQAQYWNGTSWIIPPTGADNTVNNFVNGVTSQLYNVPWVLVSKQKPLPIEIDEFYAECFDNHIVVYWSTASETNNDYFILEKSIDNINWNFVAKISGAGNSNIIHYYSYTNEIETVDVYYRLKQVDYNGNYYYINSITISCNSEIQEVIMYPNPIINEFIVDIFNINCDSAIITFYNNLGQTIYSQKIYNISNNKKQTINMNMLTAGIYYVNFTCENYYKTQKFFKE